MKKTAMNGITMGIVACTVSAFAAEEVKSKPDYDVYWKSGLRIESPDKAFKVKMGGRLQYDWTWADGKDSLATLKSGSEARRTRLYVSGTLYENIDFKAQFDWAGSANSLKDLYLGINNLPVYLKFGHFKEPFSLEELTSSKYVTFMERTSVVSAFSPSRNAGVQVSSSLLEDNVAWAAGIFRDTDSQGKSTDEGAYSATARLTGTPWYDDDGKKLLHLGVAGSYRMLPSSLIYKAKAPNHFVGTLSDTGTLVGDKGLLGGLEAALVTGPLSIQGELIGVQSDLNGGGDFSGMGWYAQASYFLTGEHRPYKQSSGTFSNVKPANNYGQDGLGAWEVALRYDSLDLNDGAVQGGELDNVSVGVNWYLNPAVRLTANYVYSDLDAMGEAHILGTRVQVAF